MPELTPAQIARLARKLSYRSADSLDWLITHVGDDTQMPVHFGNAHNAVASMLLRLELIAENPAYLEARRNWDRREFLPTDLGRAVLAVLKTDRLRFRASGIPVSRAEYGKPTDPMTLAFRDGREPTEAEHRAYFDAMYAELGIEQSA